MSVDEDMEITDYKIIQKPQRSVVVRPLRFINKKIALSRPYEKVQDRLTTKSYYSARDSNFSPLIFTAFVAMKMSM